MILSGTGSTFSHTSPVKICVFGRKILWNLSYSIIDRFCISRVNAKALFAPFLSHVVPVLTLWAWLQIYFRPKKKSVNSGTHTIRPQAAARQPPAGEPRELEAETTILSERAQLGSESYCQPLSGASAGIRHGYIGKVCC